MNFPSTVAGIPCRIEITSAGYTGSYNREAASDVDYYGEAPEWGVCDTRGRPAPWLEAKLTPKDIGRIEQEIENITQDYAE